MNPIYISVENCKLSLSANVPENKIESVCLFDVIDDVFSDDNNDFYFTANLDCFADYIEDNWHHMTGDNDDPALVRLARAAVLNELYNSIIKLSIEVK